MRARACCVGRGERERVWMVGASRHPTHGGNLTSPYTRKILPLMHTRKLVQRHEMTCVSDCRKRHAVCRALDHCLSASPPPSLHPPAPSLCLAHCSAHKRWIPGLERLLERDPKGIRWKKWWKRSAEDPARPGRAQEWRKQRMINKAHCLFYESLFVARLNQFCLCRVETPYRRVPRRGRGARV